MLTHIVKTKKEALETLPRTSPRYAMLFQINLKAKSLLKYLSLCLSLSLTCLFCQAKSFANSNIPDTLRFERIFDKHDFSSRVIRDLVQDKQGIMWFGSESGLIKYDGYTLKYQGLSKNPIETIDDIRCLHLTNNGNHLWIGTQKGLARLNLINDQVTWYTASASSPLRLSSDFITDITSTENGEIIVATNYGLNILKLKEQSIEYFNTDNTDTTNHAFTSDLLWSLNLVPQKQQLWIGTNDGLYSMDLKNNHVIRLFSPEHSTTPIGKGDILSIITDQFGETWVGGVNGVYRINVDQDQFTHYSYDDNRENSLSANIVWNIFEDKFGELWFGTDHGGLNHFNRESNSFTHYKHDPNSLSSLNSNTVKAITQDHQGNIWTGNFPSGVNYFNRYGIVINNMTPQPNYSNSLSQRSVLSLEEDAHGNLWIGTDGGGLNYYDKKTKHFTHYLPDPKDSGSINSKVILSLQQGLNNNLWIGSYREGLSQLDLSTGRFSPFDIQIEGRELSKLSIWAIHQTDDKLWLGTMRHGLIEYDYQSKTFKNYFHNDTDPTTLSSDLIWSIKYDSQGRLWVGTFYGLNVKEKNSDKFTRYHIDINSDTALKSNHIFTIHEDKKGHIWFGTSGGLSRINSQSNQFTTYTTEHGLSSHFIRSIVEDEDGNLWLGTDDNISFFNTSTNKIQNYRQDSGWLAGPYNSNASISLQSGEIAFGSINGLSLLNTQTHTKNTTPPPIILTDLKVFAQSVIPGDNSKILINNIQNTDSITLTHEQSMFSVDFSALNYIAPQNNKYAYMLEGFDRDWREIGNSRSAVYTNIDPGLYTLRIKASNSENIWNDKGIVLKIRQLPAPWLTWWAQLAYLAVFSFSIYWIVQQKTAKLRYEKNLQKKTNFKLKKLDKLKSDFLANTSHELLTPLNGIIGISEVLEGKFKHLDPETFKQIHLINASGKRLTSLVKDILDFSRLSDNSLTLNVGPVNLHNAVESAIRLATPITQTKSVFLVNAIDDKQLHIIADKDRLLHILGNLITNAIKYSDKGSIIIGNQQQNGFVEISVRDEGIGISEQDLHHIFDVFDQVADSDTRQQGGTGLGLALTKKLIELQGGSIRACSKLGEGSTFIFTLKEASKEDIQNIMKETLTTNADNYQDIQTLSPETQKQFIGHQARKDKKENENGAKILIVDDDTVNRIVLRGILELDNYQVIEADNGPNALKKLNHEQEIDLIVLDIMMPRMDGYEVCRKIREQYPMHKLPVIFLTAKTSDEALAQGMVAGGNDFLTKPTSKAILLPKVSSLLRMSKETSLPLS